MLLVYFQHIVFKLDKTKGDKILIEGDDVTCTDSLNFRDLGKIDFEFDFNLPDMPGFEMPEVDMDMPQTPEIPDVSGPDLPEFEGEMPDIDIPDVDISGMMPEICKDYIPQIDGFLDGLDGVGDLWNSAAEKIGFPTNGGPGESVQDGVNEGNEDSRPRRFFNNPPQLPGGGGPGQTPPGGYEPPRPPRPGHQGPPPPGEHRGPKQPEFEDDFEELLEQLEGLEHLDLANVDQLGQDASDQVSQLIDALDLPGLDRLNGLDDDIPDICKGVGLGPGPQPQPGPGMEGPNGEPGLPGPPPRQSECDLDPLKPWTIEEIIDKAKECVVRVLDKFSGLMVQSATQIEGEMGKLLFK